MKRFAASLLLVACLPFTGCNDQKTNPNPPTKPEPVVDVNTPAGKVKVDTGKDGTKVEAPGVNVDVNKK